VAFEVIVGRSALMPSAPTGPRANMLDGLPRGQDQPAEQPPYLGHAQREERPRLALNAARLLRAWGGGRLFFNASTAMAPARSTTSRAKAHMARVRWRYHPVQLRTS